MLCETRDYEVAQSIAVDRSSPMRWLRREVRVLRSCRGHEGGWPPDMRPCFVGRLDRCHNLSCRKRRSSLSSFRLHGLAGYHTVQASLS